MQSTDVDYRQGQNELIGVMQALLRQKVEVFDRAEMILGESDIFQMDESLENLFKQFSNFLSEALRKCPFYIKMKEEKEYEKQKNKEFLL